MKPSSAVVWQPVPAIALCYALESACAPALEAARRLFAPWLVQAPADLPAPCARWRVSQTEGQWRAERLPTEELPVEAGHLGSLPNVLAQVEYAAVGHLIARLPPQFIGLHGALLCRRCENGRERGVILVGPKEAGKSTLACALWRAGWRLGCDDFTLLDGRGRAHPTARRVSLRRGSRALLGDLWERAAQTPSARPGAEGLTFHPHELSDAAPPTEVELGAVIMLNRRGAVAAPAQLAPLEGIAAAWALLPYSTLLLDESGTQLTHQRADWGAGLAKLAARLEPLSLYDLGRGELGAMVAAAERVVG